jgi:transposase-like protein
LIKSGFDKEPKMTKARRKFTPEQKVTILREHLVERRPVSDVRDKHHLHPALFDQRQRAFVEKGTAAFEAGRSPSPSYRASRAKLFTLPAMRREALAELMEEHVP